MRAAFVTPASEPVLFIEAFLINQAGFQSLLNDRIQILYVLDC